MIQCRTPTPIEAILRSFDPDAGKAVARRGVDLVARQQLDEQRFDPAQIAMQILAVTTKIEKKITDQLSRTVIGRLPAAIDREKRMRQMSAPRRLDWSGVRPIV